ncbi:MAG: ATP-binding protein, partial [Planctomycetota bacterium]
MPFDRQGADLFFQVVSARHEKGSLVLTSNLSYRDWTATFANNAALTSAILDRLTEKCHTVVIEGPSYRMRNKT